MLIRNLKPTTGKHTNGNGTPSKCGTTVRFHQNTHLSSKEFNACLNFASLYKKDNNKPLKWPK